MALLRYITHPDVSVEPGVSVARWALSDEGRRRAALMLELPWIGAIRRIVTSDETKAIETATMLSERVGVDIELRPATGEIDRSAAGFLPPAEFEAVADECFAHPTVSVRGWERAVDAQRRVVDALADLLDDDGAGDVVVVGHGGVGTFWYCHLAGVQIERRWDQSGQGRYFTVDRAARRPLHHWLPIDTAV